MEKQHKQTPKIRFSTLKKQIMYKHIFGPVPSRRLGMSLGVDLVPHKVCSLDCVYCECGKTRKLTTERKEYVLLRKIKYELTDFFSQKDIEEPDYITLSGNGEPTLNIRLGEVISFLKEIKPHIPVAVLTNGTLLWRQDVQQELSQADLVIPSLDAAIEKDYIAINRPADDIPIDKYINGIIDFSQNFGGKIWMEVLIIPGYNDSEKNIEKLKEILPKIKAEKIQLNTLDRPGTIENLRPASIPELKHILSVWNLPNAEIISSVPSRTKIKAYRKDIENAILETISRRPCTADDLAKILSLNIKDLNKYLGVLDAEGKITTVKQERGLFYKLKN